MREKTDLILIGGGGHCLSCIEVIESTGKFNILGILDRGKPVGQRVGAYEILGSDEDIRSFVPRCNNFLITIGQIKSPENRKKIYREIITAGGNCPVVVAKTAYVASTAKIGNGTIVMHHAFVNANAKIGINGIINTGAIIEHEAELGDHCHVSTGVVINGQVKIGDDCFMGSRAVIANNTTICTGAIIGMGSSVISDINEPGMYVGVPSEKIS